MWGGGRGGEGGGGGSGGVCVQEVKVWMCACEVWCGRSGAVGVYRERSEEWARYNVCWS